MARFTQFGMSATYGSTSAGTWVIEGGTLSEDPDDQPEFSGDPLFSGSWVRWGNMVHFAIDVDFDNITDFGAGQYYLKLPFVCANNMIFSDGCLHDPTKGNEYAMLAHTNAGTDILELLSITSNGQHNPFEYGVPVNLDNAGSFHIAGTYIAQ